MDLSDHKDHADRPDQQVYRANLDHPESLLDLDRAVDQASLAQEVLLDHEESQPKQEVLEHPVYLDQLETQDDLVNPELMDHVDLPETLESLETLDLPVALEFPVIPDHEDHKDHADLPVMLALPALLEPI